MKPKLIIGNKNYSSWSLRPWLLLSTGADVTLRTTRNPYYCAVDPEGNQLPYIDQVNHRIFETPDVFNMWILNGEVDFQGRHVALEDRERLGPGDFGRADHALPHPIHGPPVPLHVRGKLLG